MPAYTGLMQLQQLAYFVAVAQEGSFTRAAERANVAQPSLSQQIKALEADLGAQLVHRARGKVGLTAAGETLLPIARRMLADAETARREIRELEALGRGRVRLGATPSLCSQRVARLSISERLVIRPRSSRNTLPVTMPRAQQR